MKNSVTKYLIAFFSSLAAYLIVVPLRGGYVTVLGLTGLPLSLLAGFIVNFILTLFLLKRFDHKASRAGVLLSLLLGCVILELYIRIISFKATLISLPDISFKVIAILLAYCVFIVKGRFSKVIISLLSLSLCLWMSLDGYYRWTHKLSFGTFSGKIEETVESPLVFQDASGDDVPIDRLGEGCLLLDFWSKTCGVCFREFPKVQELYQELHDRTDIRLYSVFCRVSKNGETPGWGADRLVELGYTFPTISIDMNDPVLEKIGVDGFPTVFIFDKNSTIVFRGNMDSAKKYLPRLLPAK